MTVTPSSALSSHSSAGRTASGVLSPVRIAVDCMGGDHGPSITLPACQAFLARHPDAELVLVGLPEAIQPAANWPRVTLVNASEIGRAHV